MRGKTAIVLVAVLALLAVASCAPAAAPTSAVPPTKTPRPTFTPTVAPTEIPLPEVTGAPTNKPAPAATQAAQPASPTGAPAAAATQAPAAPTTPKVTAGQTVNVRSGPGTNYALIGKFSAGDSYDVTGVNSGADWVQFGYNGQPGWVLRSLVNVSGDMGSVQLAKNIPPAPTPAPRPPTAVPQPTAPPAPAAPPAPRYEFNVALVQRCDRQPAGTWFEGTVYKGGQPANGYLVVFSYAADGPAITSPQISGPHDGYPNWGPGFYSHIISAPGPGPRPGDWYVWIVNSGGQRISEIAHWTSTGPGDGCNAAVVDFDSR